MTWQMLRGHLSTASTRIHDLVVWSLSCFHSPVIGFSAKPMRTMALHINSVASTWMRARFDLVLATRIAMQTILDISDFAHSCMQVCFSPCPTFLHSECQEVCKNENVNALPSCHRKIRWVYLGGVVNSCPGRHRYGLRMFWSGRGSPSCHQTSENDMAVVLGGLSKERVPSSNS
jgi:hypothetical protein